jgi:hypothetical protein
LSAAHDPETGDVSAPGINFALTRLVAGKVDAIAFVEVGPDAVALQALGMDERDIPILQPQVGHSVPWTAILPELPVPDILQRKQMAAEIDAVSGGDSAGAAVEHTLGLLTEMAATGGWSPGTRWQLDIVLVNRACARPLLDAAAALARLVLRPIAEVTATLQASALPELVRTLALRAPLRYGYHLVVAEVNPETLVVSPRTRQLFPAGTSVLPGAPPEASIDVSPVTGHAARVLALPIVARRGSVSDLRDTGALAEHQPLVTMTGLDAGTDGPVKLCVRLEGPGCPQIVPPQRAQLTSAGEPGWPELMKELPRQLSQKNQPWLLSPPGSLDLAVLIELGGTGDDVAARVRLARAFVKRFRGVQGAMIAAVGYRDHYTGYHRDLNWRRGKEAEALMVGCRRLTTHAEAASILDMSGWWDATPVARSNAAPLEDALELLAGADWGWRSSSRHVIVVIGSRPPHPARATEAGRYSPTPRACCYPYHWRDALNRLQKAHPVDRYTVLDKAPTPGYETDAWREFGAREHYLLGRVSPRRLTEVSRRLAEASGLIPPPRTQVRLAMAGATASGSAAWGPSGRAAR